MLAGQLSAVVALHATAIQVIELNLNQNNMLLASPHIWPAVRAACGLRAC